jgi:AcrR family transcriptional regulator
MNDKDIKIVNAALKVFSENGYKNSTTRTIATEAGVNESTIFRKFHTKENLFNSVMEFSFDKIGEEIDTCKLNMEHDMNSRDKLHYILDSILKIMDKNYNALHTMISENTNITAKKELSNFTTAISQCLDSIKPQNSDVNTQILALTVISFLLFVLFEDVITSTTQKEFVFNEFTEYCVKILEI